MKNMYTARVVQNKGGNTDQEGRIGTLDCPDNSNFNKLIIQTPQQYNGPVGDNNETINRTPEDLFVSAAAGCYFTTFIVIAAASKLEFQDFSVIVEGKIEETEEGKKFTEIKIKPILKLNNIKFEKKAKRILEKTENNCLIANSMKAKKILEMEIS